MTSKTWDHGGLSRHQRGYGKAHTKMRAHLIETVVLCEACQAEGRTTIGTHADHIIPLAKGGTHDRSNYQLLCEPCHLEKTRQERGSNSKPTKRITTADWLASG